MAEFRETSGNRGNQPPAVADRLIVLGSFRFDASTGELHRDDGRDKTAALTPRAAQVLSVLAARAQQLVTKQDLSRLVWQGMAVGDDALTSCIQELRRALGDDARKPRYIETWHKRGYRLMVAAGPFARAVATEPSTLVGRETQLQDLVCRFQQMLSGRRQIVLVSGEPGIGKSALVDAFIERLPPGQQVRVAHGQCLDHHGTGEPYLPLIEVLIRLVNQSGGAAIKKILAEQAPSWMAQMPAPLTRAERRALETRGPVTRERMLRELTMAIEAIAGEVPLMLKLEDIHWSDISTLDWLAHVARRVDSARIMVLATLRPADSSGIRIGLGRLVSELALHGWCHEIALGPLDSKVIEAYLATRLGAVDGQVPLREIAEQLEMRTGGNPLFMVGIVDELARPNAAPRLLDAIMTIPLGVRRFIERQLDELDEGDRTLLMAASAVRREFSTTAVAAALQVEIEQVEASCARLGRHGVYIVPSGSTTWPDGTSTDLYAFRHDLYRELLYDRLSPTRRALSHARVGRRLEIAWAGQLDTVAAELAEHFERGQEPATAIRHRQRAAARALRRSANEEAIGHLRRALAAIDRISDDIERCRIEAELQVAMGAAYMAMRGFGAPEVLEAYARAEALSARLGQRSDLFPALWGQWLFHWGRSELTDAKLLCARLLDLGEECGDTGLKLQAHHAVWATSFGRGEFGLCLTHAEAGFALYDADKHAAMASSYGNHDTYTCACNFAAMSLALAGDDARARAVMQSSLTAARLLAAPFTLALAHFFGGVTAQILGDVRLAAENAEAALRTAAEHDLVLPRVWSTGLMGWCAVQEGDRERGLAMLVEAIDGLKATQTRHFMHYLLALLADARLTTGRCPEALQAASEGIGFADSTGEIFYVAELHRLRGEAYASPSVGRKNDAVASLRLAVAIARQQGALALERRARASLGVLERA